MEERRWNACIPSVFFTYFRHHWMAEPSEMNENPFLIFYIIIITMSVETDIEKWNAQNIIWDKEFLDLDSKFAILNYISECPDIFDSMTKEEMVEEIDQYVSAA